jgi:hypothetical protein
MIVKLDKQPLPDAHQVNLRLKRTAQEVFPKLIPHGEISADGSMMRIINKSGEPSPADGLSGVIYLKGHYRGLYFNKDNNEHLIPIEIVARATGLNYPECLYYAAELVGLLPASPNGRFRPSGEQTQEGSIAGKLNLPRIGNGFSKDGLHQDGSHSGKQPAWTVTAEAQPQTEIIPPPKNCREILAFIDTIDLLMERATQTEMTQSALKAIVRNRLDPVSEKQCLLKLKEHTALDLGVLRKSLKAMRAEMDLSIAPPVTPEVTEVLRRYVYVKALDAFWDRGTRTVVSRDAVRHAHWAEMPVSDDGTVLDPIGVLLKRTWGQSVVDRVDTITFMPGSSEIFTENGAVALNVWTPPDIEPVPGDPSPFIEHIGYILDGDAVAIGYLLDFLAHLIQKPWRKIKVTILIIGEPGIGKSLLGEMMSKLIGEQNTTTIEESDLRSSFNEWMDGVQLVLVNELMTVDRQETMNRLKSYITDPWLRINRKNVQTYRYPNRANFLMFSNYESAAKIEKGDRRYFIWISKAKKREPDYYSALWRWFDDGGAQALLHFLQTRDISAFNPDAEPPLTKSKERVIDHSRNAIEAYLQDLFDAGDAPFQHDLIVINDLIDYLRDFKKTAVTHKTLSNFVRKNGGDTLGQKRLGKRIGDRRPMVWALRDVERWKNVDEGVVAEFYRNPLASPLSDEQIAGMKLSLSLANPGT